MTASLLVIALSLGAVSIRVEPPVLNFSAQASAQIEVQVVALDGAAAEDASVKIRASVGRVSAVRALGGGRFRAQLTPPAEHYPQVSLIRIDVESASAGRSVAWTSLPLQARADLRIQTKPRARVRVDVGDKSYGPATTDGLGRATVSAWVPPGISAALIHVTDTAGNTSEQPLDLKPRAFLRTQVAAEQAGTSWADASPLWVEVYAVDAGGAPMTSGVDVLVSASSGTLGAPVPLGRGVFRYPYRASTAVGNGRVELRAAVTGLALVSTTTAELRPGPVQGVAIQVEPSGYQAGSGGVLSLSLRPVDAHGNALPASSAPGALRVTSDFGEVSGPPSEAALRLPDAFGGRVLVNLHAVILGTALGSTAVVQLRAAEPVTARTHLSRRRIRAGEAVSVAVELADRFGNPVEHAVLTARTSSGAPTAVEDGGHGHYTVLAAVARTEPPGRLTVQVSAGRASALSAPITVTPFQRSWGPEVGVSLTGQTNFVLAQALVPRLELGLHLGRSNVEALVEGELDFYARATAPSGHFKAGVETRLSGVGVAVGARASWPLSARFAAHGSLVVGFEGTGARLSAEGVTRRESQTSLVLRIAAGASYALGQGQVYSQLEASEVPARGSVHGNLGGLGLGLGYLYGF